MLRTKGACPLFPPVLGVCSFFHRFRAPIAIVYLLIAIGVGVNSVHRAVDGKRSSEFASFREIVQEAVVKGNDHYQTIAHLRAYPPFFAIGFAPFGIPPVLTGAVSFVVICIVFAALSGWLCARACFGGRPLPGATLVLLLLPSAYILTVIARCETDLLVLLPLAGAFALMSRNRRGKSYWLKDVLAGALLAFAAAFKITPALFGLFLLVQRRWAALLSMMLCGVLLVGGLGLIVWGPEGTMDRHRSWAEKVLKPYSEKGPTAFIENAYREINQSPTAALFRVFNEKHGAALEEDGSAKINVANFSVQTVRRIASGVKLLVAALLVVAWWISARSRSYLVFGAGFASVALGMLMLGDVSLVTHHVTLLFPLGVCLAALAGDLVGQENGDRPNGRSVPILPILFGFPAALALMLVGGLHIGKIVSTLAAADVVLMACMLAIMFLGGKNAPQAKEVSTLIYTDKHGSNQ